MHGGQTDPVDLILACFWPSESSAWVGEGAGPGRIRAWLVEAAPCLPMSVAPRLQQAFFGSPAQPEWKQLDSRILDMTQTFLLRGMDSRLWISDEWQPLYCDWRDGRSFSSFMRGVVHYPGVALVLMRLSRSGIVLGAMGSAWEEGRGKYVGGPDTLLFSLRPSLQVLRTSGPLRAATWIEKPMECKITFSPRSQKSSRQEDGARKVFWIEHTLFNLNSSSSAHQKWGIAVSECHIKGDKAQPSAARF